MWYLGYLLIKGCFWLLWIAVTLCVAAVVLTIMGAGAILAFFASLIGYTLTSKEEETS